MASIDPLTAGGVLLATALTDAVYVMFTSAVVARKPLILRIKWPEPQPYSGVSARRVATLRAGCHRTTAAD